MTLRGLTEGSREQVLLGKSIILKPAMFGVALKVLRGLLKKGSIMLIHLRLRKRKIHCLEAE
jgi:hypothetical protein